jgi:hypothetical protein
VAQPDQGKLKPPEMPTVSNRPEVNPLFDLSMAPDGKAQKADKQVQRQARQASLFGHHEPRKAGNRKAHGPL